MFVLALTMLSCGGGGDDSGKPDAPDTPEVTLLKLLSTSPAEGAGDLMPGDITILLNYDKNISFASNQASKLSFTGGTLLGAKVVGVSKTLTVQVNVPGRGTDCVLTVPAGVVTGPQGSAAPQVTLRFSTLPAPVMAAKPVAATQPAAVKVYEYLLSIYGTKTLSASMANVNWNIAEAELVKKATGKYPAIATFDYIHLAWSPANWIDYTHTKVAEDWWNANGLIAAGWHWNVPATEADADLNHMTCTPGNGKQDGNGNWTTTFRPKNVTVEGTWENKVAKADLEKIAGYLKLLQDKGIPVIWRPLHEAAGNIYEYQGGTAWFWWGYDGAEAYKKLWRYMFDFFKEKGLNNLIWVWTAQTKDEEFYPGDDYVDIIGRDIYNQQKGSDNAAQYSTIVASYSNKMVALSECGTVADIPSQWNAGAKWLYFMPWYHYDATTLVGHQHADEAWWKETMKQEYVLSRDDLPGMK